MFLPNSLALRLFLSASVWIFFTLFCGGLLLSNIFRETSQKAFDDKLNLFMETLIGASKVDSRSSITVVNQLGDPRFFQPYSGWYWQINKGSTTLQRSRSMWDQVLTIDKRIVGGRAQFIDSALRKESTEGNGVVQSHNLAIIQREISFPGMDQPLIFMLSGNTEEYEENIAKFNTILISSLFLLGLGLFIAVFLQVRYGLLPLGKIKNSLFKIRNGDATKLEGNYPSEVWPLAEEINILLDHNEKIVNRAKTHVGNLAHALKTPLAVINNQITKENKNILVSSQIKVIESYVNKYLKKATTSSDISVKKSKINVFLCIKKILKIFRKINTDLKFDFKEDCTDLLVVGNNDDFEEVFGNLLENASKWAKSNISIRIKKVDDLSIKITIDDDGPGLPKQKMNEVFVRGLRLDEQMPGTGLGLNIVKDIVENHSGKVWLEKSNMGGLRVIISLPLSI
ncbi:MAG: hypothetical protein CMP33_02200 [Rickettsiales bacterium]|nr:hypothetical protein [Rickettsiales bacterium]